MPNKRKFFEGEVYEVPTGKFTIIELDKVTYKHALIEWIETGNTQRIRLDVIKLGNIKNPFYPSVEGVGYLGVGDYSTKDRARYNSWASMIARCYRTKLKERHKTYEDCYCSEEWKNYQNYSKFYEEYTWKQSGWHLDKDLLILGNKKYSQETCVFLPPELNNLNLSCSPRGRESASGYMSVTLCPASGKWMAQGRNPKRGFKKSTLGRFVTPEEAAAVVALSEQEMFLHIAASYKDILDPRAIQAFVQRAQMKEKEAKLLMKK